MSGNTVKLNVGGTVFVTLKSTLTKHDGFFKTLVETELKQNRDYVEDIYFRRTESQYPEDGPFPNEKPYWTFLVYNSTRSGRRPFRHTVDLQDCMGHM